MSTVTGLTDRQRAEINGRLRNVARHYYRGVLTTGDMEDSVYLVLAEHGFSDSEIRHCIGLILSNDFLCDHTYRETEGV